MRVVVVGATGTIGTALDLPSGVRIHTVSPPFINESAAAMGMPQAGQLSAADNAKT